MKKFILTLVVLILSLSLHSSAKEKEKLQANRVFDRLMEYAHPTPEHEYSKISPVFQSQNKSSSIFLDVNTIDDEEEYTFRMQNESSIAVNPTNPDNLIASSVDYRANSSTWIYVSQDGGKSWKNLNLGHPFEGWRSTNDPSVAFSDDGIGYLVYGGFGAVTDTTGRTNRENGVFLARSVDDGKTWEPHIPVILHKGNQTLDSTFEDKYYIEVDNSPDSPYYHHLYIPWKRVVPRDSSTQIVISKSTDLGSSWSEPVAISHRLPGTSEDTTFGQSFPLATTGPQGNVYVAWNHGIEHGVGFSKSTDGGKTWTDPRIIHYYEIFGTTKFIEGQGYRHTVKGKVRAEAYPVIMSDYTDSENRGNLYLTWAADRTPNVYFSRSTDQGETWTEPVIVHSDTTNDQFWQWMSLDPLSGELAIMYFDSRRDPDNILVECYVSYSNDAGETWTDRRAADRGSDLRLNPFSGNSFAGDYSGNAFYDGIVYPSWVDMRAAEDNIRDSDVHSAIVKVNAPAPPEDLQVDVLPKQPDKLDLSWVAPSERSFGQELKNEDYKIVIRRNGTLTHRLPGGTSALRDTSLTPYTKYSYEIYAETENWQSVLRIDSAYSGGVPHPDAPYISKAEGSQSRKVDLTVNLPTKRADNQTPLVNLNGINVYQDDELVDTYDTQPGDTGTAVNLITTPEDHGYYSYHATVLDSYADIENESNSSNTARVYTGKNFEQQAEDFDEIPLPHYLIKGKWQTTDEISYNGNNSFSVAPYDDYEINQNDTLRLMPVEVSSDFERITFQMHHIAAVRKDDKARLEVSFDEGGSWEELAVFHKDMYEPWDDGVLNQNDWKHEIIDIPLEKQDEPGRMFLQFVFNSNQFGDGTGWYIDRVRLNAIPVGVPAAEKDVAFSVYPNPANSIVSFKSPGI